MDASRLECLGKPKVDDEQLARVSSGESDDHVVGFEVAAEQRRRVSLSLCSEGIALLH